MKCGKTSPIFEQHFPISLHRSFLCKTNNAIVTHHHWYFSPLSLCKLLIETIAFVLSHINTKISGSWDLPDTDMLSIRNHAVECCRTDTSCSDENQKRYRSNLKFSLFHPRFLMIFHFCYCYFIIVLFYFFCMLTITLLPDLSTLRNRIRCKDLIISRKSEIDLLIPKLSLWAHYYLAMLWIDKEVQPPPYVHRLHHWLMLYALVLSIVDV